MPVIISEIITEAALPSIPADAGGGQEVDMDDVVRRATERVLEILRREWDQ